MMSINLEQSRTPEINLSVEVQISRALKDLVDLIEERLGDKTEIQLIMGGSFGRRLVVADAIRKQSLTEDLAKPLSLDYYFKHQNEGLNKQPRRSNSGRYDFDLAIRDDLVPWEQLNEAAEKVTLMYPDVEIDLHVMKLINNDGVQSFYGKNRPGGVVVPLETIPVDIGNGKLIHVMSLRTQIYYLSTYSFTSRKNFSEIKWLYDIYNLHQKVNIGTADTLVQQAKDNLQKKFLDKSTYQQIAKAIVEVFIPKNERKNLSYTKRHPRYF